VHPRTYQYAVADSSHVEEFNLLTKLHLEGPKKKERKKNSNLEAHEIMFDCEEFDDRGPGGILAAAGMRQIAHRQPSIHGTVSYQWRSSNSTEEQHTGTSQRSQFSHQRDSVLTGQSVYGYLWHSSWFSASYATFGKMYAALEATGR